MNLKQHGIAGLPAYQEGGQHTEDRHPFVYKTPEGDEAGRGISSLVRDFAINKIWPAFMPLKKLIESSAFRSWEDIKSDPLRNWKTYDQRYGPPLDDPRLEQLQPLADSLQAMLPDPDRVVPFSFREPEIDEEGNLRDVWGEYQRHPRVQRLLPWQSDLEEHIALYPEGGGESQDLDDLRQVLMHEYGHAGESRGPDEFLSKELRDAIYGGEAPFDLPGGYEKDKPGQRYADYFADAVHFLQASNDPNVDLLSSREYLEEVPHTKRVVGELLKKEIYKDHPLNFMERPQIGGDPYRTNRRAESFYVRRPVIAEAGSQDQVPDQYVLRADIDSLGRGN